MERQQHQLPMPLTKGEELSIHDHHYEPQTFTEAIKHLAKAYYKWILRKDEFAPRKKI